MWAARLGRTVRPAVIDANDGFINMFELATLDGDGDDGGDVDMSPGGSWRRSPAPIQRLHPTITVYADYRRRSDQIASDRIGSHNA